MPRARLAVAAAAAAVLGLLAGCASVPTSGPIHNGRDISADRAGPDVRVIGRPPAPGASPSDIVEGFLQASADLTDDSAAARSYLTPDAAADWSPSEGVTVYSVPDSGSGVTATATNVLDLKGTVVARVDATGHYTPAAPETDLSQRFVLRKVAGEWRIATPGPGLLLSGEDLREAFRRLTIYFGSPGGSVLVPDPVFVPARPELATLLVQRLIAGVPKGLTGAALTALPAGSRLVNGTVPLRNGVAQVNISTDDRLPSVAGRRLLSAQLVWTLKQLVEVQAVRVIVDGTEIQLSGVGPNQPRDSWSSFDPSGLTEGAIAYAVRADTVQRIDGTKLSPVPGPAGDGREPLLRPAVSLDASQVAGISPDGRQLRVGRLQDDATFSTRLKGTDLSTPSWDLYGDLWVVDRRADGSVVWVVPASGPPQRVEVVRPAAGPIWSLRVSRDGARVAVVAGASRVLLVGTVVRTGSIQVAGLHPVLPELSGVLDAAWADATTLAAVGRRGAGQSGPFLVDIDGASLTSLDGVSGLVGIAAAPGSQPIVGATSDGRLVQFSPAGSWSALGVGEDPAYPG